MGVATGWDVTTGQQVKVPAADTSVVFDQSAGATATLVVPAPLAGGADLPTTVAQCNVLRTLLNGVIDRLQAEQIAG